MDDYSFDVISHESDISFAYFAKCFLCENKPCLFQTGLTSSWKARQLWQIDGKPNFDYLEKEFGSVNVPVANCNVVEFSSHSKDSWNFSKYLSYWRHHITSPNKDNLFYLKDWHFTKDFPSYSAYDLPCVFTSDWLNESCDRHGNDDYRFVYMGPKETWTPFHADVLRSYSWSVNICGKKEWLLYQPGDEEYLRDKYGNLPIDIMSSDLHDKSLYPHAHKAKPPLRIIQEAGEAIFIPSGWYHQVKNLADTISINHNWINCFNIRFVWNYLKKELLKVEKEINDCRSMDGWVEQCQLILKSETGMDFVDFYSFLETIIQPRLDQVKTIVSSTDSDSNQPCDITPGLPDDFHITSSLIQDHENIDAIFLTSNISDDLKSSTLEVCDSIKTPNLKALLTLRVYELNSLINIIHELKHTINNNSNEVLIDIKSELLKILMY